MTSKDDLLKKIEEYRLRLNKLISEKDSLQDPEVIKLSTALDLMINEYNIMSLVKKGKSTIK